MAPIFPRTANAFSETPAALRTLGRRLQRVASLSRRQNDVGIIPPSYQGNDTDLDPGAVAGIVLGAVLGTLFIIWLVWWATQANRGGIIEEDIIVERRPRSRSPRRRGSRRSSHRDMAEYRSSRSYSPRRPRTQIVEERVVEERIPVRSRGPSPIRPHPVHETVILEDRRPRRHSGEDEVVVIQDESDYSSEPRYQRRRSRRNSGYRPVDPDRIAGGSYVQRPVRRHS